jgi:hypothetical protein
MSSKNLTLIVNEANEIEQMLIDSFGSIDERLEKLITVNKDELAEKIDGYDIIFERLDVLAKHYKQRAEFFSNIAKGLSKTEDRLKENIKTAMSELKVTELEGNDIRFKLSNTKPSMVVLDEDAIPREYFEEITVTQLNKSRLRDDLAIGPVPGAKLEESFALRTYANNQIKKAIK